MRVSRCGLCKYYHYDFEDNDEWCEKDNRYFNNPDCPNYELSKD